MNHFFGSDILPETGEWKRGVAAIEPSVFVVNESFSKNETDFDLIAIVYLCYSLSYLLRSPISKNEYQTSRQKCESPL